MKKANDQTPINIKIKSETNRRIKIMALQNERTSEEEMNFALDEYVGVATVLGEVPR